jgi:hypothetical protein
MGGYKIVARGREKLLKDFECYNWYISWLKTKGVILFLSPNPL